MASLAAVTQDGGTTGSISAPAKRKGRYSKAERRSRLSGTAVTPTAPARHAGGATTARLSVTVGSEARVSRAAPTGGSGSPPMPSELLAAAAGGNHILIRDLLRAGANVNARDKAGWNALTLAAESGHSDAVRMLVTAPDLHINARDTKWNTPLMWAARYGLEEIVDTLLAKKASVDRQNKAHETAIILAAQRKHPGIVRKLIAHAYSKTLQALDWKGKSALMYSAELGDEASARQLVINGADTDSRDTLGRTPLMVAAMNGHYDVVHMLVAATPEGQIDAISKDGSTALLWATGASKKEAEIVAELVDAGADLDAVNHQKRYPLLDAVFRGNVSTVKALLDAGANPDGPANVLKTPLMGAAEWNYPEVAAALVAGDASVIKKTRGGRTPVEIAFTAGNMELLELIDPSGKFRGLVGIAVPDGKGGADDDDDDDDGSSKDAAETKEEEEGMEAGKGTANEETGTDESMALVAAAAGHDNNYGYEDADHWQGEHNVGYGHDHEFKAGHEHEAGYYGDYEGVTHTEDTTFH